MDDDSMDMRDSKRSGRGMRAVHSAHRALGSLLSLVLATWFASGMVMTFARYPEYSDAERLADAARLPIDAAASVPPELEAFIAAGALREGLRARLSLIEGAPTWTLPSDTGPRRAWRVTAPYAVTWLDEARARREAERRLGMHSVQAAILHEADQWTVGRSARGDFPLYRIAFDDRASSEAYVSARSGEVLQLSTRSERALAWLGPIPHWIYPAILRRHRALWSNSVLALAALGLLVSLSGIGAGTHALWSRRHARRARPKPVRDGYLRWHQRIGLGFGAFVSTWLFSGALSLSPFAWTGPEPSARQPASIYAAPPTAAGARVTIALAHCQQQLSVRELELGSFAGTLVAVCADARGETRIVELNDAALTPRRTLSTQRLDALAQQLSPAPELALLATPDAYYYDTHAAPPIAKPYVRVALHDAVDSAFYFDPAHASLLAHMTRRKRLERWLYHGMHSLDFPWLYRHATLWQCVMVAAMCCGFSLAMLGFTMRVRRAWKRRARN
jgi:hypothetical protein